MSFLAPSYCRYFLYPILPLRSVWQLLRDKLQVYNATAARNCRWRGTMNQEWSHEDRITPISRTRHGPSLWPILNQSI
jgi:hypothetical protein